MKYHVFISYLHEDYKHARAIEVLLTKRGFEVWRDPHIPLAADFEKVIAGVIRDSQMLLVVTHTEADFEWVKREIAMARRVGHDGGLALAPFSRPPPTTITP